MTPIDRYLRRISFWLPRRGREDVLAELRGALEERVEAAEARQGRSLRDHDVEGVLQEFGHPLTVVAQYVRRRPVISGGLAHPYWRVLGITLGLALAIQLAVLSIEIVGASESLTILSSGLRRTAFVLLLGFACVTGSFMILERRYGRD